MRRPLILTWFLVVFAIASLNPVYTDEIAYDYMLGRFFRDGWGQFFMWPECGSFHQVVPLIWRVPRGVVAAVYHILPNLLALRALGLGIALFNCYLLYRILSGFFPKASSRSIATVMLSLTVGVLPFLMVLMRPEGILVFLAFSSVAWSQSHGYARPRLSALLVSFGAALAISTHPLGVIETPIFLACLFYLRLRTRLALPLMAAVVMYAGASVPLFDRWLRCDEISSVATFLEAYRRNGFANHGLLSSLFDLPNKFVNFFTFILVSATPSPGYMSGLVPLHVWGEYIVVGRVAFGLVCGWLALFLWFGILALGRAIRVGRWGEKLTLFPVLVGVGTLSTVLSLALVQPMLLAYRLAFVMPYLVLGVGILGFSSFYSECPRLFVRLQTSVASCACASCLLAFLSYVPRIVDGIERVVPEYQPHSTNHLSGLRPANTSELLVRCGIKSSSALRRMFVDEHTYWLFRDSSEPVFFTYYGFANESLASPEIWRRLLKADAEGIVIHCETAKRLVPHTDMRHVGEVCCLNREDLDSMAKR